MLINGNWMTEGDGITRPFVEIRLVASDGSVHSAQFLIDTGADRTVFTATLLDLLQPPLTPATEEAFAGVGGFTEYLVFDSVLEFATSSGTLLRVRGQFAGFVDPRAMDVAFGPIVALLLGLSSIPVPWT